MKTKTTRLIATLGAAGSIAAALAGCGGVPGNAVAEVDGEAIEKSSFDHWMTVAAKSSGQPNAAVPDSPEFTKCVATKKKTAPKPAEGQPKQTDAQLKEQCKQEYGALRDQVMQLLISFEWIQGEAEEMNIKVSDAEVRKEFDRQKKASFPKDQDYKKFLKDSGQTEEDILLRVKLDSLSTKIREKITKGKDKVSNQQVQAYYDKNKTRFAAPERRDLRIVLTKDKAKAEQAKSALEDGDSWTTVAKKYSIDQATKAQGGKLPAVAKGQQEAALDKAVFGASKGELAGPVKTQFGYYVFEVSKVEKASQQSLQDATPTIKQLLASENQQKALDSFVKTFRKDWKEKTDCRESYKTADCKGEKDPPATPQGGQGQGQPGQGQPGQQGQQQAPPTAPQPE